MIEPNYHSYRDPVARVVKKQDGWYRYIFKSYQEEFDHLMLSGLYRELTEKGLMISHEEIQPDTNDPEVRRLIRPEQVPFQSYPFEWSYRQWRKATLAILEINRIALKHGMVMKDATPFNFYLTKGKAVLLDTTSFIFFVDNDPWVAYKQFCEEFLSPLALMHYNGVRWSHVVASHTRGLPLPFVSRQLSQSSWLNPTCLVHIHLHAKYTAEPAKKPAKKGFNGEKLQSLLSMISSTVSAWDKPYRYKDHWLGYYQPEMEDYLAEKEKVIIAWLEKTQPETVIDLGANTGRFALIASKYARYVVAMDRDDTCIDELENTIEKESIGNLTALTGDLAQPSPSLGVLNREYDPIFSRGRSDMVFGLALIHHLCIELNISVHQIAEMFSLFARQFAVIEFVPKEDERVVQLITNRGGLFTDYSEESFKQAFANYFDLEQEVELTHSKRKLILYRKKSV